MMLRFIFILLICNIASGCAYRPMNGEYAGPTKREPWVECYYPQTTKVDQQVGVVLEQNSSYSVSEITLFSKVGETKLEFYKKNKASDELVVVFPILGGKYWFERYIARYFVERGIDAVIILRNPEFKKPENIDRIEDLLKQSVQRDRLALDYFHHPSPEC